MMKTLFTLIVLVSASFAVAQSLSCVSVSNLKSEPDRFYQLKADVTPADAVTNVILTLSAKDDKDEHKIISSDGVIFADSNFHPRTSRLLNYDKFVLEKNELDQFLLFLPKIISEKKFRAYVKIGFQDTYPALESMDCTFVHSFLISE